MSSPPTPIESAESMAAFLRTEISHRKERIVGIKERRERMNTRFQAQRDAAAGSANQIVNAWKEAGERNTREQEIADAEMFAFRRALQFLTGELW